MITKMSTKGSSDISMSLLPPRPVWANAGVISIDPRPCAASPAAPLPGREGQGGVMPHAELARRPWPVPGEIGADYSRRGPNCNAADRRKRGQNSRRNAARTVLGPTGTRDAR